MKAVLIFILMFLSIPLVGLSEVNVTQSGSFDLCDQDFRYYSDRSGVKEFSTISSIDDLFIKNTDKKCPSLGYTPYPHWFYFNLRNTSNEDLKKFLSIDYPTLDFIDIYIVDKSTNQVVYHKSTGDARSFKTRPYPNRSFIFPFTLKKDSLYRVYLKIKTSGSLNLPVSIHCPETFHQKDHDYQFFIGGYAGIMLVMIFYNFFIFIKIKDKSHLFYVLYIFSWMAFILGMSGVTVEYLLSDNTYIVNRHIPIALGFSELFTTLFAKYFLNLGKYKGRIKKGANFFTLTSAISILLSFLIPIQHVLYIHTFNGISLSLYLLITSLLVAIKYKNKPAIYFATAWSILLIGFILIALKAVGVLSHNFLTVYSGHIGSVIEVVLLSLGLSHKIDLIKEKQLKKLKRINEISTETVLKQREINRLKEDLLEKCISENPGVIPAVLSFSQRLLDSTVYAQTVGGGYTEIYSYKNKTSLSEQKKYSLKDLCTYSSLVQVNKQYAINIDEVQHIAKVGRTYQIIFKEPFINEIEICITKTFLDSILEIYDLTVI